jgi:hypothetical protein
VGCNAVYLGNSTTFRRTIWPPSSGSESKTRKKAEEAGGKLSFDSEDGSEISPNYKELQFATPYPSSLTVSRQQFCMHFSSLSCVLRTPTSLESFLRSKQSLNYSRTSQRFMDSEVPLPCSQELTTGPYPEPD